MSVWRWKVWLVPSGEGIAGKRFFNHFSFQSGAQKRMTEKRIRSWVGIKTGNIGAGEAGSNRQRQMHVWKNERKRCEANGMKTVLRHRQGTGKVKWDPRAEREGRSSKRETKARKDDRPSFHQ
jgi:hypothetical protein